MLSGTATQLPGLCAGLLGLGVRERADRAPSMASGSCSSISTFWASDRLDRGEAREGGAGVGRGPGARGEVWTGVERSVASGQKKTRAGAAHAWAEQVQPTQMGSDSQGQHRCL